MYELLDWTSKEKLCGYYFSQMLDNKAVLRLQLSNRFSFDHPIIPVTFIDRSFKCDSGPGTINSQRMVEVMQ